MRVVSIETNLTKITYYYIYICTVSVCFFIFSFDPVSLCVYCQGLPPIIPRSPLYQGLHYSQVSIIPRSPSYQGRHYTTLVLYDWRANTNTTLVLYHWRGSTNLVAPIFPKAVCRDPSNIL